MSRGESVRNLAWHSFDTSISSGIPFWWEAVRGPIGNLLGAVQRGLKP